MCEISVIVPVYNAKSYIYQCIKSILEQSFEDFECIVVDDGSTDGSVEELQDLSNDERLYIVRKKNEGQSQARKAGLDIAKGKYIAFVDADDYVDSYYLEKMYNVMLEKKCDMVCSQVMYCFENGRFRPFTNLHEIKEYDRIEALRVLHTREAVTGNMYAKLFRAEIIKLIDFVPEKIIGEDYCVIVDYLERATSVVQIPDYMYFYRIHGNNISKGGYSQIYYDTYQNYKEKREYLVGKYQQYSHEIESYYIIEEIAIINSMIRGGKYDRDIYDEIRNDLIHNVKWILNMRKISIFVRISVVLLIYCFKVYKIVYLFFRKLNLL